MSLFLSLGFLLFSLFLSLSLFSWEKAKISKYFLYTILGIFGFIFSWILTYLSQSIYGMVLTNKFFPPYTLVDEIFSNWLLFIFPLLFIGFFIFSLNYRLQKNSFYSESLYFWWLGFFSSFSLYFLLQETNKYSLFEYILLPVVLISLFLTVICFLNSFKNSNILVKISVLFTLSFIFSLPQSFYYSLYSYSLWISTLSCILLGLISLYFLRRKN